MRAAQINSYGAKEALKINNTAEKPRINSEQVLVEVYAAGVNPFDVGMREGKYQEYIHLDFPATLGGDLSGIVAEIGDDVKGFSVGQKVYGMANAAGGQGSFAEYSPVVASQLYPSPENLDFDTAGALPLTAISAYQALVDHMKLQPGQKILIHGGAGGIGTMAIQIASHIGAHVITTAVTADHDYVKNLGAKQAIDYSKLDFSELLSDLDAVFDTVGGETSTKSYKVLKQGGSLVSMLSPVDEKLAAEKSISYVQQSTKATPERLQNISELVEADKLKVVVDRVFKLDEAAEALEHLKSGHPRGKVVIQVKS